MIVSSVNIGEKRIVIHQGKEVETGIFKAPVAQIELGLEDVVNDDVVDRKYHGGIDKACYAFGANHYDYFKNIYPEADWTHGAFGENITLKELDEKTICIGDTYSIGNAVVEVASPRQPCFKLGIRIGNPMVINSFMNHYASGIYFRVLKPGIIRPNDDMKLIEKHTDQLSVWDVHKLFIPSSTNIDLAKKCMRHEKLAVSFKESIQKKFKL